MRVVVTSTNSGLSAQEIVEARAGDSGVLAVFEIDAPADTATSAGHTVALSGTVYAQALYQSGGGIDTMAPVQTITP